jgi:hypothetical protein
MMDRDLKKRVEKAALIRLASPFLKVPQAICVNGADNNKMAWEAMVRMTR